MPPSKPSATLTHQIYSRPISDHADPLYLARPRIDSRSESVNGGVFYPHVLAGQMEAITVDYDQDPVLKDYILDVDAQILKVANSFAQARKAFTLGDMLSVISSKIATDFPYSSRMTDRTYLSRTYQPGVKYRLGVFMRNQDMICRHMGLLVGAILSHLKENTRKNISPGMKPETEVRFMAETQADLLECNNSGHAYIVVKRRDTDLKTNLYFIVDPSGARAVEIKIAPNVKRERSPTAYRYLFSLLRVLFQKEDPYDDAFLKYIFDEAKTTPNIHQILQDLKGTLQGVDSIRRFQRHQLQANLKIS